MMQIDSRESSSSLIVFVCSCIARIGRIVTVCDVVAVANESHTISNFRGANFIKFHCFGFKTGVLALYYLDASENCNARTRVLAIAFSRATAMRTLG